VQTTAARVPAERRARQVRSPTAWPDSDSDYGERRAEDLGGGELRERDDYTSGDGEFQSIQIEWWTLSYGARVAVALAPQRDNSTAPG
jgi:hypothetical protein